MLNPSDSIYETAKLYEIISWLTKNAETETMGGGEKNSALIKAAVEYIRRGYMLDIKIADIASHIGCDRTQLYRMFIAGHGTKPAAVFDRYAHEAGRKACRRYQSICKADSLLCGISGSVFIFQDV